MLNKEQIKQVLRNLDICNLRIEKDDQKFIMPIHFKVEQQESNFIFTLKGKLSSENIRFIETNPNVVLEFIEHDGKVIRTVVALGAARIISLKREPYQEVKIKAEVTQVAGRCYSR